MKELQPFAQLLQGFSDSSLKDLLCYLVVTELEHGEEFITEGKHTESLFLLAEGQLTVLVGPFNKQAEVAKIFPGGWVGEVSMLDPGPASATVRSFVRAKLFELSHKNLKEMMEAHPEAAHAFLKALSASLAKRLHFTSEAVVRKDQWKIRLAHPDPSAPSWLTDTLKTLNDTSPTS